MSSEVINSHVARAQADPLVMHKFPFTVLGTGEHWLGSRVAQVAVAQASLDHAH
jgi:hypothetical protein